MVKNGTVSLEILQTLWKNFAYISSPMAFTVTSERSLHHSLIEASPLSRFRGNLINYKREKFGLQSIRQHSFQRVKKCIFVVRNI